MRLTLLSVVRQKKTKLNQIEIYQAYAKIDASLTKNVFRTRTTNSCFYNLKTLKKWLCYKSALTEQPRMCSNYFEDCFASLAKQSQHFINHWNKGIPSVAIPLRIILQSQKNRFEIFPTRLNLLQICLKLSKDFTNRCSSFQISVKSINLRNFVSILFRYRQNHSKFVSTCFKTVANLPPVFPTIAKFFQCVRKITSKSFQNLQKSCQIRFNSHLNRFSKSKDSQNLTKLFRFVRNRIDLLQQFVDSRLRLSYWIRLQEHLFW